MLIHTLFDLLAALVAVALIVGLEKTWLKDQPRSPFRLGDGYFPALGLGAVLGSYLLGSANLWLSGQWIIGRSVLGALVGGTLAVEIYKRRKGIRGSTGLAFAAGFAALVAVGRIGCALSGLEDNTFGTPTTLPWAQDFGDGILRHPVAAYEALAMAGFLAVSLWAIWRQNPLFLRHGFYLMTGFYALQRFGWEFLKPYAPLLGPFTLFHFICVGLLLYSILMLRRNRNA